MLKNIISIFAKGPESSIALGAGKENLFCGRSQLGILGSMFWEQKGEGRKERGPLPPNQELPVTVPMETGLHPSQRDPLGNGI